MTSKSGKILVLGGAGFLGSHLVESLLEAGYAVRSFSRCLPGLLSPAVLTHARLEVMQGLLEDRSALQEALEGCTACVHLISTTLPFDSNLDPIGDVRGNLIGTLVLLEVARTTGLERLIFVSSGGTVYGIPRQVPIREDHPTEPICAYGITKRAIELHLALEQRLHGLDQLVVRLANPYGERQRTTAAQGAVAVFLGKALRGETIDLWGDGSTVRDFLYVGDAIAALLRLLDYRGRETIFNVGSGRGHSLRQVLGAIEKVTGRPLRLQVTPARSWDVPSNVLSIERARRELGWHPKIDLEEGIERFARSLSG